MLRFVNDYGESNLEPIYLPIDNKWRLYYITIKDIKKDVEL